MVDPLSIFVHENPVVSAILLTLSGFLGFLINAFILLKVAWHKVFPGSFGWIWISRGVAYCTSSFLTMVCMGFGSLLFPDALGILAPTTILMGWIECVFANLLIALNRCLLITHPFSFKQVFTNRNTVIFIIVSWFMALMSVVAALYLPCNDEERAGSLFSMEPSLHCSYIFIVFTYGPMWLAIATTLLIDLYSILTLHRTNKVRDRLSAHNWSPQHRRKILKLCYMLAAQCVVNPLVMFIVTIGDDVQSPLLSFLSTVFLLSLADSIDGKNESLSYEYMENEAQDVEDDFEHRNPLAASVILVFIDLSCVILHGYILYKVVFRRVFGQLFGWIWISRQLALVILCVVDGALFGSSLTLYPDIDVTKVGQCAAQLLVVLSIHVFISSLLIAFNRCLLIQKPLTFKNVFTTKKTAYLIALAWLIPTGIVVSTRFLHAEDVQLPKCFTVETLLSGLIVYSTVILTFVSDMAAIWTLRQMSKIRTEFLSNHLSPGNRRRQLNFCYMLMLESLVAIPSSILQAFYDSPFWNVVVILDG
ncbi:hypothetical protein QR680_007158 [Steinernema hermaphroditum]|uniref:G-protein coupled receptors family 1 profile domain-containing protein n=1 Tax=Steinernema hermaphroditum TaxID=289476 RepID=A0AA39HXW0_9BILA|nr:hypothetical protein QR680_007158 [Steinernema hermaphroditum]